MRLNPWITEIEEEGAFAVLDKALALKATGKPVINLGIGQPDLKPAEHIIEAGIKAMRDGPHGYTPITGIAPLREAIASHINNRYKSDVSPQQVVIVPGGKMTFYLACLLFGSPGSEILYPDPGFPPYREAIKSSGAIGTAYPIHEKNNFSLDAQELLSLITPRTRMIILNSPANPTGGVIDPSQIDILAKGLMAHPDIVILSDEIYSNQIYNSTRFVSLMQYPELASRLILLDGWSKTFAMTGWRLGYGIWPKDLIPEVRKMATVSYSCVNIAAQMAGLAAITGPMETVVAYGKTLRKRRDFLVDGLNEIDGISCHRPGGAFYVFPNITATGFSSIELAKNLLQEAYLATIPGDSFGAYGSGFLRISYAAPMNELELALIRIRQFIQSKNSCTPHLNQR